MALIYLSIIFFISNRGDISFVIPIYSASEPWIHFSRMTKTNVSLMGQQSPGYIRTINRTPCTDNIKGNGAQLGCGLETAIFLRGVACRADYCGLSHGTDSRLLERNKNPGVLSLSLSLSVTDRLGVASLRLVIIVSRSYDFHDRSRGINSQSSVS